MERPIPRAAMPFPSAGAVLELFKPITWFPPMWAFICGMISSGEPLFAHLDIALLGLLLAGPMLCATSQAVNDWFDRHVDAINEPGRPIPSGRVPGRWGLGLAIAWSLLSAALALALGPVVFVASLLGLTLAWAYSAPPMRFKTNGWLGNAAVGLSYEGLAWVTGAAVLLGGAVPATPILLLALLYSIGAHGIMTLNDFKSIAGDQLTGVRSLPVQLGPRNAAVVACWSMAIPQGIVVGLLAWWDRPWHALAVWSLLVVQVLMMRRLRADPIRHATWYSAWGVTAYVSTMMIAAFAVGGRLW
jgi:chlorophyll/bacteriochlorophyll a synthase